MLIYKEIEETFILASSSSSSVQLTDKISKMKLEYYLFKF